MTEMASNSEERIEIFSCENKYKFQIKNSKIKNENIKLPNVFEKLLKSLVEELPSKENLPSLVNLNNCVGKYPEKYFSCSVAKETSSLLSYLEDYLSTVLARKRFENGHAVNNLSSLTLSYARAFFAQALANLQAETKKNCLKKDWRSISHNFTEEAAEKYINYLAMQIKAKNGKEDLSMEDVLGGDDDSEELHSLLSLDSQSDESLSQTTALTPTVKENIMTFDSTPSFAPYTPTLGIKPKKGKGFKSPFLTPVLVESSGLQSSDMPYEKKADKQFGKKRLNFSTSALNNNSMKMLENCKAEEISFTISKSDESKENFGKRKVFVSTLITEKLNRIEPEPEYISNKVLVPLKEYNNLVETPLRRTSIMFTSPHSPPCKRQIFASLKESHTSSNKDLPDGYKITRIRDALHYGQKSRKLRVSRLNNLGARSRVRKQNQSRASNSRPLDKCEGCKVQINGNSPMPCMPKPSHWAPKKEKRQTARQQLPRCRRSLIRQFQQLSMNPQFMDTPPGSPGSFALLPLLD